jgi:TetR/AcrR family transcriptional repressor of nem operon
LVEQDSEARVELATGFARWEAAIRAGLTNMQQRGELDAAADPAGLALALLTAVQGGLLMTRTRRDTVALEAVLAAVIATVRQHESG